jgi:hypothetical protein
MDHLVTGLAKYSSGRAMILTTVVLVLFAAMLMMAVEYPYSPANGSSLTNVNRIDTTHNTHCNGDSCQTLTCINNNCQSMTTQLSNQPQSSSQLSNQPQSSSQLSNQPQSSSQLSTTPCYLPCLPSR